MKESRRSSSQRSSPATGTGKYSRAKIGHPREFSAPVERAADAIDAWREATNLPDLLVQVARTAQQCTAADCVLVYTLDTSGEHLLLAVHLPAEREASLEAHLPALGQLAQEHVLASGRSQHTDLRAEVELGLDALPQPTAALFAPLIAFGDHVGLLVVLQSTAAAATDCAQAGAAPFGAAQEQSLALLANYTAIAIKNACLAERARDNEARVRDLEGTLHRQQRLAALGENLGRLTQELHNPMVAITGLARTIERELDASDPNREYARVILREAQRVEERLQDQREFVWETGPRLARRQANDIVRAAIDRLRDEIDSRGTLLEEIYAEAVPELLLDGSRLHQALGNVLRRSLESTRDSDTLRVETLRQDQFVLIEIAHTGESLPGDVVEELFVPFAADAAAGTGLGLAVAQQILHEHGGEVSVRCAGEWAAIYTLSLPIPVNQERRRPRERRSGRDRRQRPPQDRAA